MTAIEQVETFSEAGNSLPRLIHSVMLLKLMILVLGSGDTRNPFVVTAGLQILRWFLYDQSFPGQRWFSWQAHLPQLEKCVHCSRYKGHLQGEGKLVECYGQLFRLSLPKFFCLWHSRGWKQNYVLHPASMPLKSAGLKQVFIRSGKKRENKEKRIVEKISPMR